MTRPNTIPAAAMTNEQIRDGAMHRSTNYLPFSSKDGCRTKPLLSSVERSTARKGGPTEAVLLHLLTHSHASNVEMMNEVLPNTPPNQVRSLMKTMQNRGFLETIPGYTRITRRLAPKGWAQAEYLKGKL